MAEEKTIQKSYIISTVYDKLVDKGVTKEVAKEAVDLVFATIKESLASDEVDNVTIYEFGTFKKTEVAGRKRKAFGKEIEIPAHGSVKFKASKVFKDLVK